MRGVAAALCLAAVSCVSPPGPRVDGANGAEGASAPETAVRLDVDELERRDLAVRFPGTEAIGLVKILRVPERAPGGCVADFPADPATTQLRLSYATDDGERFIDGEGLDALARDGWLPAWRTPAGVGFEKSARFRRIDLELEQVLVCRCFDGDRPVTHVPSRLRVKWSEGERVAVSASAGRRPGALPAAISAGRLLRYEFRIESRIPGRPRGSCAARLEVMLLVEPPFV